MDLSQRTSVSPMGSPCKKHAASQTRFQIKAAQRPGSRHAAQQQQQQQQFELMQRASDYCIGSRHFNAEADDECGKGSSCDWIFEEADVIEQQRQRQQRREGATPAAAPDPAAADLCALEAMALMPLLSLNTDSVFLEIGLHCRGRLPLNLALNCEARECISLCPDLQQTVNASQLCSPIIQSQLPKCPVKFVCAEPHQWGYRGVTHVLLHNAAGGGHGTGGAGFDGDTCRAIASRLAASDSFSLLVTTAPLPFQHHLVYIGEAVLEPARAMKLPQPEGQCQAPPPASGSVRREHFTNRRGQHVSLAASTPPTRTVYLYSTSFANTPVGTLATLFCHSGMCCLPGAVFHAASGGCARQHLGPMSAPSRAAMAGESSGSSSSSSRGIFELPPLALHTAAFQDLCSASSSSV